MIKNVVNALLHLIVFCLWLVFLPVALVVFAGCLLLNLFGAQLSGHYSYNFGYRFI